MASISDTCWRCETKLTATGVHEDIPNQVTRGLYHQQSEF